MPATRAEHKVYNTAAWQRARRRVLERDEGLCVIQGDGCTITADCVDHIVPWRAGGDLYSLDNLRAACTHCNSSRVHTGRIERNVDRDWYAEPED